jgi:hypothetical protein
MAWYLNHYRHDDCDVEWTDEWSCMCNDRCPECRYEIEPYDSEDLSIIVKENPSGGWIVRVSSDEAEHDPDYSDTLFATQEDAFAYAAAKDEERDLVASVGGEDRKRSSPAPQKEETDATRSTVTAKSVRFDSEKFWVELSDGRTLGVPLSWFPRLLRATPEQRERVEIGRLGLHWEEFDEDISIAGLLAGRGDQTRFGRAARADLAVFDEIMSRPGGLEPPEEDRL